MSQNSLVRFALNNRYLKKQGVPELMKLAPAPALAIVRAPAVAGSGALITKGAAVLACAVVIAGSTLLSSNPPDSSKVPHDVLTHQTPVPREGAKKWIVPRFCRCREFDLV